MYLHSLYKAKKSAQNNAFIKFFVHFIKQGWESAATQGGKEKNKSSCFFREEFY